MKVRYKILINIICYVLGISTVVAVPIVKWSILAPIFGKKVDIKRSIDGLALKDGVILQNTISTKQQVGISSNIIGYRPSIIVSQEYPSSQGFGYQQSIDLNAHSAVMTYQDSWQPFWLGISNAGTRVKNIQNPILFLNFKGKIKVKVDENSSQGWVETDPSYTYFLKTRNLIQPKSGIRLNPLFVEFPEEGTYSISYSVTADNELPISGEFDIKVVK